MPELEKIIEKKLIEQLPKFRYYTQCMAELRKTLDEEIKPLLTIAG